MRTGVAADVILLLAAVAVTLGLKAAVTNYRADEDMPRLERDIAATLVGQGFMITRKPQISRPASYFGVRGTCRVFLRTATAPGSLDGNYRELAAPIGPLRYRIAQADFALPPTMRLWWRDSIRTTQLRIGLSSGGRQPALVLAQSPACAIRPLVTSGLRVYPLREGR